MSSVGAMILYAIREDLLFGIGIPLGLVGVDRAFTQLRCVGCGYFFRGPVFS